MENTSKPCRSRRYSQIGTKSLKGVVEAFKKSNLCSVEQELNYYRSQENFEALLDKAGGFEDSDGRKHFHQHRITHAANAELKARFARFKESEFRGIPTFDALYDELEHRLGDIHGIGDLTIYDTATRFGAYFNISPEKIYLHQGTREGAEALFGKKLNQAYLLKSNFPEEFDGLTADQIESLLCIFKTELLGLAGPE